MKNDPSEPEAILAKYLRRNGYVRVPNPKRRERDGQAYKKGYEVRFVARSTLEINEIRRALVAMDLEPAKPFAKHQQMIQPVYGKQALERLRSLCRTTKKSRSRR